MKASFTIAALILVVGAFFGWQEEQKLAVIRGKFITLAAEAASLGIPTGTADNPSITSTRSERDLHGDSASATEARAYAAELIAFAVEMKAAQETGQPLPEEIEKGIFIHLGRLAALDTNQLRILIDEVKRSPALDEDIRRGIIGFSINMLADDHPETALAMAIEAKEIFGGEDRANHLVAGALTKWAARDPVAALDWLRQNAGNHPGIDSDDAKCGIIKGAATQDPRLALRLIDEFDITDIDRAARAITEATRSSEQRSALLDALRAQTKSESGADKELIRATLASLGSHMTRDGFESSAGWLEQNKLSDEEATAFAAGLGHSDDTARWIDWMADKLPSRQFDDQVRGMVTQWASADYAAAGTWLGEVTGPARIPAVAAYAATIAPYEPAAAANWALTLPTGEDRSSLLQQIRDHWKSQDEPAATRFAEQHGLQSE